MGTGYYKTLLEGARNSLEGVFESLSNDKTKKPTTSDEADFRLQNKRTYSDVKQIQMDRSRLPGLVSPRIKSGVETNEDSMSILDRAYSQVRRQNAELKNSIEADADESFYTETGDELGQVKPPVKRKGEYPRFEKVVPTFNKKQKELQSYIFEKAKDRGYEGPELAQFMAQVAIETDYFRTLEEYGPGKDRYGGGKQYKGRGFLQLTHKDNYEAAGKALGFPRLGKGLADDPNLVLDRELAAETSFWFWETNVRPAVKDFSNTNKVTRIVNGPGMLKKAERNDAYNFMKLSGTSLYEE